MSVRGYSRDQLEFLGRVYACKYAAWNPLSALGKIFKLPKTPGEKAITYGTTALQVPAILDTSSVQPITKV